MSEQTPQVEVSGTSRRRQIVGMKPKYEAILNWLIDNPTAPIRDCAEYFGVTPRWMYIIVNSDAFRARLVERQDQCFNTCVADLREKTHGAAHEALDLFMSKIHAIEDPMKLLKAVDSLFDKLGYGGKANIGSPQHYIQNNTTVQVTTSPEQLTQARAIMDKALALREPRPEDDAQVLPSPDGDEPNPVTSLSKKEPDSTPEPSTTPAEGRSPEALPEGEDRND